MKISVVIPARNEEKTLPRLLKSLNAQDFPKSEFEVVVVDNNSTDQTANIARLFGARVVSEKKRGIPFARDTGIRYAKGEIIVGTDADCLLPKNFLRRIYTQFTLRTDIVGLCGTVRMPDAPLIVKGVIRLLETYGHWYTKTFTYTSICWALNFSFKKNAFDACHGYDLNRPLLQKGINAQASEEYVMVDRLMKTTKKKVIFDKTLKLQTSGRRFKNRVLYWFIMEHLIGFVLNEKLYNLFGVMIPTASYYERVSPNRFYFGAKLALASSLFFVSVYTGTLFFQTAKSGYSLQVNTLAMQEDYQQYEKMVLNKFIEPVKTLESRYLLLQEKRDISNPTNGFLSS